LQADSESTNRRKEGKRVKQKSKKKKSEPKTTHPLRGRFPAKRRKEKKSCVEGRQEKDGLLVKKKTSTAPKKKAQGRRTKTAQVLSLQREKKGRKHTETLTEKGGREPREKFKGTGVAR